MNAPPPEMLFVCSQCFAVRLPTVMRPLRCCKTPTPYRYRLAERSIDAIDEEAPTETRAAAVDPKQLALPHTERP